MDREIAFQHPSICLFQALHSALRRPICLFTSINYFQLDSECFSAPIHLPTHKHHSAFRWPVCPLISTTQCSWCICQFKSTIVLSDGHSALLLSTQYFLMDTFVAFQHPSTYSFTSTIQCSQMANLPIYKYSSVLSDASHYFTSTILYLLMDNYIILLQSKNPVTNLYLYNIEQFLILYQSTSNILF